MNNIINIDDYVTDALTKFGKEVNTNRQLAMVNDGLKVVYRRIIYTSLNYNKMVKTATLSGAVMGSYHPHSSDAIDSAINSLVRWGIFDGQGSHGLKMIIGEDITAAASRYSEAMIGSKWRDIISRLIDYVPFRDGELDQKEPEFIPTPLPMILLFSGLGIGFGANARYPMFTAKSMLNALINDDPTLLEAPFGLKLNPSLCEFNDLWNKGLGRLTYEYNVEDVKIPAGRGTMISGSAEIFKPLIDSEFKNELEKGQVYILDQTAGDIPQVFIGISPYVRSLTYEDIYDRCKKICSYTRMFRLTVTDGNQAYCIPLKEWLKESFNNYVSLVEKYKNDQINRLWFDYDVYDWMKTVTDCLLEDRNRTAEDIYDVLKHKCKLDVIKAILRKSISTLRNTESIDKLKGIKQQIKEFEKLDPKKYTIDLIYKL